MTYKVPKGLYLSIYLGITMEKGVYEGLGLKIGLEIHQQLAGKKLFCACPAVIKDGPPDVTFTRQLRASASELGDVDVAARFEELKKKYFVYEAYHAVNCLVDLDESPPEAVNADALQVALQVAVLLHAQIVDGVCFMRKVVIDGSNVSGFQRTAVIGMNGYLETSLGTVSISSVALEEEAAKKEAATAEYAKYNISRLGIPLIEIATGPEIKTPEHAKEVAGLIGMVLRSVPGVKTGLGSIRQDVNLSIRGHPRVEIKGFQDLRSIPKVVEYEMQRQQDMMRKGEKVVGEVRKAEPDLTTSFLRPMPGAARLYPETDVQMIAITKEILEKIEVPVLLSEKVESLEHDYDLPPDLAREIVKRKVNFDYFAAQYKYLEPKFIAQVLINVPKEMKARLKVEKEVRSEQFEEVLGLLDVGKVPKDAVLDVLAELVQKGTVDLQKFQGVSEQDAEAEIKKIVAENKGASMNALMGLAMQKFRGKVEGKKLMEWIKKYSA